MPRWTEDELRSYELRTAARARVIARANATVVQEQKDGSSRSDERKTQNDHRTEGESAQEETGGRFAVRIVVGLSDNRTRDLDGILATVMDCLIAARRRLMEICPEDRDRSSAE